MAGSGELLICSLQIISDSSLSPLLTMPYSFVVSARKRVQNAGSGDEIEPEIVRRKQTNNSRESATNLYPK